MRPARPAGRAPPAPASSPRTPAARHPAHPGDLPLTAPLTQVLPPTAGTLGGDDHPPSPWPLARERRGLRRCPARPAGRGGAVAFVVLAASGLGSPLGTVSGPFLTPGARRSWGSARAAGAGRGSDPSLRSPVTGHRCDCGWPTQTLLPPPLWPCSSPLPCPRGRAGGGACSAPNLGRGAQGRGVGEAAASLNSTRLRPQVSGKAKAEDELVKAELSVAVCKQNHARPFINRIWRPSSQQHPPPDPSPLFNLL